MDDQEALQLEQLTESLYTQLQSGDMVAGQSLVRLYRPGLLRLARRYLQNEHDAEDAIQETFARILEAKKGPDNFRIWSYRIARNVCLNQIRSGRSKPQQQRMATGLDLEAEQTGQFTRMVRAEDSEALLESLAKLSEAQREVLMLRYIEGLDRNEIAGILDLSVGAVKSRLFEGLNRLRQFGEG
jgi:RNA polymerase sigma-70 factor (ECF subfamily)